MIHNIGKRVIIMSMYTNPNADTFTSSAQNHAHCLHHLELSVNASLQREDGTNLCVDADFEVDAFARLLLWRQEHCTMQQLSVAQLDELLCWIMQKLKIEAQIASYLAEHPEGATSFSPETLESVRSKAQYLYWHLLVLYEDGTVQQLSGQDSLPSWLNELVQKLMTYIPEENSSHKN